MTAAATLSRDDERGGRQAEAAPAVDVQAVWTRVQAGQYIGQTVAAGTPRTVWTVTRQGRAWGLQAEGMADRQARTMADAQALAVALDRAALEAEAEAARLAEAEADRVAEAEALSATPGAVSSYRCGPCKRQGLTVPAARRMRFVPKGRQVPVCPVHAQEAEALAFLRAGTPEAEAAATAWLEAPAATRSAWLRASEVDALQALPEDSVAAWRRISRAAVPDRDAAADMAFRMLRAYVRTMVRAAMASYPAALATTVQAGALQDSKGRPLTPGGAARAAAQDVRPRWTPSDALEDVRLAALLDADRGRAYGVAEAHARSAEAEALTVRHAQALPRLEGRTYVPDHVPAARTGYAALGYRPGLLALLEASGTDVQGLQAQDAQADGLEDLDARAALALSVPAARYVTARDHVRQAEADALEAAQRADEHRARATAWARSLWRHGHRPSWTYVQAPAPAQAARPAALRPAVARQVPEAAAQALAAWAEDGGRPQAATPVPAVARYRAALAARTVPGLAQAEGTVYPA